MLGHFREYLGEYPPSRELANLLVQNVHGNAVIVRSSKNKKDREVTLPESVSKRLQ
jgi:hypothetical protein